MADQPPPNDLFVTSWQFTRNVHRDVYPAIDPSSPSLSQAGKVVIVTGASQGIGRAIAVAFAKAGAEGLALFARNTSKLEETKAAVLAVKPSAKVVIVAGDTTSQADIDKLEAAIKENFSRPHVLVNCAGIWLSRGPIKTEPVDGWWRDIEVNVKGTYMATAAFLRLLGDEKGSVVSVSTFGSHIVVPNCSSYSLSKSAMNRFTEYVAAENPNVTATCYNPGSVATAILDIHPDFGHFAHDTLDLCSAVAVYLASPRAEWLSGRYISANWDIEDLEAKKEEVLAKDLLKLQLKGDFGAELFKEKQTK